jgi:hypothetical protein
MMQIKKLIPFYLFLLPTFLFAQRKYINLSSGIGIINPRFFYEDRPDVWFKRKSFNNTIGNYLEFRTNYKNYYLNLGYIRATQKFEEINTLGNKLPDGSLNTATYINKCNFYDASLGAEIFNKNRFNLIYYLGIVFARVSHTNYSPRTKKMAGKDTVYSGKSLGTAHQIRNTLAVNYQLSNSLGLGVNLSLENVLKPYTENEMRNTYVKPSRSMFVTGVTLRYNF